MDRREYIKEDKAGDKDRSPPRSPNVKKFFRGCDRMTVTAIAPRVAGALSLHLPSKSIASERLKHEANNLNHSEPVDSMGTAGSSNASAAPT